MEKSMVAIIGGGAAGLFAAAVLSQRIDGVTIFEQNDRLGKKLSATGNGQGNVTNVALSCDRYFSVQNNPDTPARLAALFSRFSKAWLTEFLSQLGVLTFADERGRVYPTSRQASSVTDALRFSIAANGVDVRLSTRVCGLQRSNDGYVVEYAEKEGNRGKLHAKYLLICTGGKAAKNFGTDGGAYSLAGSFGHTLTALYPSLVQLKTDVSYTKTLKGIRAADVKVTAYAQGQEQASVLGDLIFTEYGASGDAVFRLSAYLTATDGERKLYVDFLPDLSRGELTRFLTKKRQCCHYPSGDLLCGVLNNQIARAVEKYAKANGIAIESAVKKFPLTVTGNLGFDYAQVTKGGVPLLEVTDGFESIYAPNAYLLGELLDIDGECGGFNLHFAFASAAAACEDILSKIQKTRGQV